MTGSVALHSLGAGSYVEPDTTFFTFESGRLSYDCRACGAKCCRGHGYLVRGAGELRALLALRPAIRFFLVPAKGHEVFQVNNFGPGCFFLQQDGLCRVQLERGYTAKPETCRLFPFNRMRQLGGFLVVSPHAQLCPLDVVDAGQTHSASFHEGLWSEMSRTGIASPIARVRSTDGREPSEVIGLERGVLSLAAAHFEIGNYLEFLHAQRLAA